MLYDAPPAQPVLQQSTAREKKKKKGKPTKISRLTMLAMRCTFPNPPPNALFFLCITTSLHPLPLSPSGSAPFCITKFPVQREIPSFLYPPGNFLFSHARKKRRRRLTARVTLLCNSVTK